MTLHGIATGIHIGAGALALGTFWTAALARKGSRPHILAGRVYLLSMLAVIASGVPLVAGLLARGHALTAAFLAYLLVLVTTTCWSAWRAIRDRRAPERYAGAGHRVLNALVLAGGLTVAGLGLRAGSAILVVFGLVGVVAGTEALWRARRGFTRPGWWLREHYGAMMGNAVATHVAFFSIGLRSLVPGMDGALVQYLAWFGPLAAALAAAWWLDRRYGRGLAAVSRRA